MCQEVQFSISSQEELKHFEVKIEKHNHYQKQLEISHQKLKHVGELWGPEPSPATRSVPPCWKRRPRSWATRWVCGRQPAPELIRTHGAGGGCTALGFGEGWAVGQGSHRPSHHPRPRLRAPHQVTSKRFGVATPTGRQAGQSRALPAAQVGRVPALVLSDLHPESCPVALRGLLSGHRSWRRELRSWDMWVPHSGATETDHSRRPAQGHSPCAAQRGLRMPSVGVT